MLLLHSVSAEIFKTAKKVWLMFRIKQLFWCSLREACLFLLVYFSTFHLWVYQGILRFKFPIFPLDSPYAFKNTVSQSAQNLKTEVGKKDCDRSNRAAEERGDITRDGNTEDIKVQVTLM